jgi:hypothetical protein
MSQHETDSLSIGIDNGITGAMAALAPNGEVVHLAPLPVTTVGSQSVLDAPAFWQTLESVCAHSRPHILIEPAQIFSPGKKALCSTRACYGALRAILEVRGYPWEPVQPQRWQRVMFADHVREADQKEDARQRKKAASILVAQRLFPNVNLARTPKSKVPDPGLADALLIAEFCRRKR